MGYLPHQYEHTNMSEKLQKILANNGVGSRRELETWISAGRVSVNGKIAVLGDRAEPTDQIRVDGHLLSISAEKPVCRVLMYNKPEGELCTRTDPEGRMTVFDRLPNIHKGRWIAVGRLDLNTSGLLLFTNDGELANRLMHPRHEIEREYAVRVFGEVEQPTINTLLKGVELDDGIAKFTTIHARSTQEESINSWFNVTLSEGRNREVRRLWESQGVQVSRLIRLRYGPLELKKRLPQGAWMELELPDVNVLRKQVQLPAETETVVGIHDNKLDHGKLQRMRKSVKKHQQNREKFANFKEGQAKAGIESVESTTDKPKYKHKKSNKQNDKGRRNQRHIREDEPRGSGKPVQKKRRSPAKPKSRTRI